MSAGYLFCTIILFKPERGGGGGGLGEKDVEKCPC